MCCLKCCHNTTTMAMQVCGGLWPALSSGFQVLGWYKSIATTHFCHMIPWNELLEESIKFSCKKLSNIENEAYQELLRDEGHDNLCGPPLTAVNSSIADIAKPPPHNPHIQPSHHQSHHQLFLVLKSRLEQKRHPFG